MLRLSVVRGHLAIFPCLCRSVRKKRAAPFANVEVEQAQASLLEMRQRFRDVEARETKLVARVEQMGDHYRAALEDRNALKRDLLAREERMRQALQVVTAM